MRWQQTNDCSFSLDVATSTDLISSRDDEWRVGSLQSWTRVHCNAEFIYEFQRANAVREKHRCDAVAMLVRSCVMVSPERGWTRTKEKNNAVFSLMTMQNVVDLPGTNYPHRFECIMSERNNRSIKGSDHPWSFLPKEWFQCRQSTTDYLLIS